MLSCNTYWEFMRFVTLPNCYEPFRSMHVFHSKIIICVPKLIQSLHYNHLYTKLLPLQAIKHSSYNTLMVSLCHTGKVVSSAMYFFSKALILGHLKATVTASAFRALLFKTSSFSRLEEEIQCNAKELLGILVINSDIPNNFSLSSRKQNITHT